MGGQNGYIYELEEATPITYEAAHANDGVWEGGWADLDAEKRVGQADGRGFWYLGREACSGTEGDRGLNVGRAMCDRIAVHCVVL